jgi:hypothetical protein
VFGFGGLFAAVLVAAIFLLPRHQDLRENLPDSLSDAEFWSLVNQFSEPGGYFRSDNFVSNETAFQRVIPTLKDRIKPGGVYLGVGPEQNFTYVAALQPKLVFIIDIRRQNMLLHLMYKALFELSRDRVEFISKLFARPVPAGTAEDETVEKLFDDFAQTHADPVLAKETFASILENLHERHHLDLSQDDSKTIDIVYNAFVSGGPDIRYSFPNQYAWRRFPTYSELMLETDGTTEAGGENHSYLASDENFQLVKNMQSENRIIPIVGDFGGDKALRSVGKYLREHHAAVSAFYTSNVEFYLFQTEDWRKFYTTVSKFPLSNESVFVRSYFNNYGLQFQNPAAAPNSPPPSYTLLDSMMPFTSAFGSGSIRSYTDVIRRSLP